MKRKQLGLIILLILLGLVYMTVPSVKQAVNQAITVLSNVDLEQVVVYIRGFGPWAAGVSFLLMVLQSIISPIPAFLITLANAAVFGWVNGALLSWSSAMAGAALCFYIARILGREAVVKLTSVSALSSLDHFFEKYGKHTILVCRLLPFVSFDIVSYAAGLTAMTFPSFLIATGIGQLPATLVYSYVGQNFSGGAKHLFIGLLLLFAVTIIIYVVKKLYEDKRKA